MLSKALSHRTCYLILPNNPMGLESQGGVTCFIDEDTGVQRGQVVGSMSHSILMPQLGWSDLHFGELPGFVGNILERDNSGWEMRGLLCPGQRSRGPLPPGNGGTSLCHLPPRPDGQAWVTPSAEAVSTGDCRPGQAPALLCELLGWSEPSAASSVE